MGRGVWEQPSTPALSGLSAQGCPGLADAPGALPVCRFLSTRSSGRSSNYCWVPRPELSALHKVHPHNWPTVWGTTLCTYQQKLQGWERQISLVGMAGPCTRPGHPGGPDCPE